MWTQKYKTKKWNTNGNCLDVARRKWKTQESVGERDEHECKHDIVFFDCTKGAIVRRMPEVARRAGNLGQTAACAQNKFRQRNDFRFACGDGLLLWISRGSFPNLLPLSLFLSNVRVSMCFFARTRNCGCSRSSNNRVIAKKCECTENMLFQWQMRNM